MLLGQCVVAEAVCNWCLRDINICSLSNKKKDWQTDQKSDPSVQSFCGRCRPAGRRPLQFRRPPESWAQAPAMNAGAESHSLTSRFTPRLKILHDMIRYVVLCLCFLNNKIAYSNSGCKLVIRKAKRDSYPTAI
jgi:hypothetical protein